MATAIGNKEELERFLATIDSPESRQPGEFTAREIHAALKAKGDTRSYHTLRQSISNDERYVSRQVLIGRNLTKVYRLK